MPEPTSDSTSRMNVAYVAILTVAASVILVMLWLNHEGPILGSHPALVVIFSTLVIALEVRPLPSLTEDSFFTFSWTFAFTLLLVAPIEVALSVCAAATVLADLSTRRPVVRVLFNAAQFVVSLSLAWGVAHAVVELHQVRDGGPVTLRWLAGVLVLLIIGIGLNSVQLGVVVALHQRLPVGTMALRFLSDSLSTDGLLFGLAPVFVIVGVYGTLLIPVLLLTVWIVLQSASIAMRNREDATHDQLTGLPNRRMFNNLADLALEGARQSGSGLAVIHIDLDGFKGINDRLGHHFGDQVLKEIAVRLRASKRSVDQVARLGGDEFAVLLSDINDPEEAKKSARRMLELIELQLDVEQIPLAVSASFGIAMYPRNGEDLHTLLHCSDLAMYQAKRAGTGVEVYTGDSSQRKGPGRLAIISELAVAIKRNDQLFLHYQPIMQTSTGKILRVEALLRWKHPEYGIVSPDDFMPQTEQTDLMGPLTDKIVDMAFKACAEWHEAGINIGVSVNASARNLHDLRFPERIAHLMDQHGVRPDWVEIEITENTIMEDVVRSSSVLGHLRQLGLSIAIDDFGTGFSSLVALRDLTIDRVKIDRSFVTNLAASKADLTIVRSVVELAANLGVQSVAEGVETVEVLNKIEHLGCDEYQGFLASSPRPINELLPILRNGYIVPVGFEAESESITSGVIS